MLSIRRASAIFCILLCACSKPSGSAAAGIESIPSRICSVNLAADEMLAELVSVERMAAVNVYVDDPGLSNAAGKYPAHIPRVRAELERVLTLNPDLVCVNPYNTADFLDYLQKSGRPVFRYDEVTSIAGIQQYLRELGKRVGAADKAEQMARDMDRRLDAVAAALKNITKKPRIYYWAASWTAGSNTTIHEIIERAGAVNAGAENARSGMYEMPLEDLFVLNPDILLLDARDSLSALPGRDLPAQLQKLRAVKDGRVVFVAGKSLTTLSHFIVDGVEALARELHPECFAINK
ncbi:MAG: ABC transporter substrate-binding protein [Planctomycetota bacterium]